MQFILNNTPELTLLQVFLEGNKTSFLLLFVRKPRTAVTGWFSWDKKKRYYEKTTSCHCQEYSLLYVRRCEAAEHRAWHENCPPVSVLLYPGCSSWSLWFLEERWCSCSCCCCCCWGRGSSCRTGWESAAGLFHFRTSRGRSLKNIKKSVIFMFSSSSTRVAFKPQGLPFIPERSLGRSWFWFGQQRRERERKKQKILSILLEYPNCTCLSTSTSLTHRPFALAKTTLRPLSVCFLGRRPEERLAKDSPRCTHADGKDTHGVCTGSMIYLLRSVIRTINYSNSRAGVISRSGRKALVGESASGNSAEEQRRR